MLFVCPLHSVRKLTPKGEDMFSDIFNLDNYLIDFYEVWYEWTPQIVLAEISYLKLKSKLIEFLKRSCVVNEHETSNVCLI
jgi:hypothetical protein